MKVLVVGSGGREHALAWKIAQSERVTQTFVAPGNAGTAAASDLTNVPLGAGDIPALCDWITEHQVGLVVVGPEAPLVDGLADRLRERGVAVVGPNADGALLEGSKAFAKEIMSAAAVPTARYARAETAADVDAFCDAFDGAALVVKADGLPEGRASWSATTWSRRASKRRLCSRGPALVPASLVLEERLIGIETSYIVLVDGERYVALPTSQTTSACSTAIAGRTQAAWELTRRPLTYRRTTRRPSNATSSARRSRSCDGEGSTSEGSSTPGSCSRTMGRWCWNSTCASGTPRRKR